MKYHGPLMYFSIYIPVSVTNKSWRAQCFNKYIFGLFENLRSQKSKIIDPKHAENYVLEVRKIYR